METLPKIYCIQEAHPKIVNKHYKNSVMTLEQMALHYNVPKSWLLNKIKFGETFE